MVFDPITLGAVFLVGNAAVKAIDKIQRRNDRPRLPQVALESALPLSTDLKLVYDDTPLGPDEIRVALLHAGAKNEDLYVKMEKQKVQTGDFEAISYRWQGAKDKEIGVNEVVTNISGNLYDCLRRLRPSSGPPRKIWFDALCIDQRKEKGLKERKAQLKLMGQIYSHAKRVIIWLREFDSNKRTKEVMDYFNELRPNLTTQIGSYEEDNEIWLAFGDLILQSDWWGRAWMVQEMVNAKEIVYMCGSRQMDEALFTSLASFNAITGRYIWTELSPSKDDQLKRTAFFPMWCARLLKKQGLAPKHLASWIWQFHMFEATEKKDRINAYLGLVHPSSYPHELMDLEWRAQYREFTNFVIRDTASLDILSLGRGPSRDKHLPSWVPDLSMHYAEHLPLPSFGKFGTDDSSSLYNASGGARAAYRFDKEDKEQKILIVEAKKFWAFTRCGRRQKEGDKVCLEKAMDNCFGGPGHPLRFRPYPGNPDHTYEMALGRTLMWDLDFSGNDVRNATESKGYFETPDMPADCLRKIVDTGDSRIDSILGKAKSWKADVESSKDRFRIGRRIATTNRDYVAMVPGECTADDVIFLLRGATVPMAFRKTAVPGQFKLLGPW
ncbi:hypothetical protein QQS21_005293 [Conoideocrella luteorostrata]|uniref:Heterokaryon incompatibility domain-containing protein n=1 Tax=Conoideocrella luteorostrata TaxID=1105319 RepID=A0AAJ0CSI0_9HYPO|nr:hypothetical protein QQS21_005293 [Conoideocrella luteorostrata]